MLEHPDANNFPEIEQGSEFTLPVAMLTFMPLKTWVLTLSEMYSIKILKTWVLTLSEVYAIDILKSKEENLQCFHTI